MKSGNRSSAEDKPPHRSAVRDFFSLFLLGFFFAVALSPHTHLNDLEDLLLGGPSDSGVFLQSAPSGQGRAEIDDARLVDDIPCLACFHDDFVTAAPLPVHSISRPGAFAFLGPLAQGDVSDSSNRLYAARSPPLRHVSHFEIPQRVGISYHTVHPHVKAIHHKARILTNGRAPQRPMPTVFPPMHLHRSQIARIRNNVDADPHAWKPLTS